MQGSFIWKPEEGFGLPVEKALVREQKRSWRFIRCGSRAQETHARKDSIPESLARQASGIVTNACRNARWCHPDLLARRTSETMTNVEFESDKTPLIQLSIEESIYIQIFSNGLSKLNCSNKLQVVRSAKAFFSFQFGLVKKKDFGPVNFLSYVDFAPKLMPWGVVLILKFISRSQKSTFWR